MLAYSCNADAVMLLQFTELNKKEQLARLSEARAAEVGAPLKKFKFVSSLSEQVSLPTLHAYTRVKYTILVSDNGMADDVSCNLHLHALCELPLTRQFLPCSAGLHRGQVCAAGRGRERHCLHGHHRGRLPETAASLAAAAEAAAKSA